MSGLTFRRAVAADVPLIHQLLCENAENDGGHIAGGEASLRRHGFGPSPRFRVLLAFAGEVAQGLTLYLPEYSSWRGELGLYLQDIYLRPAARGQGGGRALLAATLRDAADWEVGFVTLIAHRANEGAQGFYARLGFTLRAKADLLICEGGALRRLQTE
jgi:GNAT superfamily N-acetyltransferase